MALLDFLGDVGTVVSPGLEAYGGGRLNIEKLMSSIQNNRLQRLLKAEKQAEQKRQFEVTSGLGRSRLAELIRHQTEMEKIGREKLSKPDAITAMFMASRPDLFPPKKAKDPGLGGVAIDNQPGPKSMTPEEYALKGLQAGASLKIIAEGLKQNYGLSDDEINSYLQERLDTGSPVPTAPPGPPVGQMGYGPLTQGNPQGGFASLSGSPIDVQQYLPPKEEVIPGLQRRIEGLRWGPLDVQQYLPRKGYRIPRRTLGQGQ